MKNIAPTEAAALEAVETREWLESLDYVLASGRQGPRRPAARGAARARAPVRRAACRSPRRRRTSTRSRRPSRCRIPATATSSAASRASSAGTRWRWSCAPTASRTASAATSRPTRRRRRSTKSAFNHFFRGKDAGGDADVIYFQGHASPGIYARAFLEGRLTEEHLRNFRHELRPSGGLSSYPHPWLMPDFWEFPTVSMGLGPLMAIYQARFIAIPRESRPEDAVRSEGLGVPRRRRDRRAGSARARSRSRRARSSTT